MKGKLKTKRFGALVDSLSSSSANHLGPYGGGKFREHSHMTLTEVVEGEGNPKIGKHWSSRDTCCQAKSWRLIGRQM